MIDGFRRRDMERPTTHRAFVQQLLEREDGRFNTVDYVGISLPRFTYTITLCKNLKPDQDTKVLDVGRSYLSFLLAQHYVSVCTLGIPLGEHGYAHEYAGLDLERRPQNHITFNLNDAQEQGIETEQQFDLIVFAEVLEHLYTAPELVLYALRNLLTENGLLVCLTPNAAALPKRLRLLQGINPYERIRINRNNPGHYRECTKGELEQIGRSAGLEMIHHSFCNHSPARTHLLPTNKSQVFELLCRINPAFCLGQTAVYRKGPTI